MSDPNVISEIVQRFIDEVHTTIVGRVVAVHSKTIDVQPVTKKVLNGSIVDMPLFKDVPPIFLKGGGSYEAYPITVGDYCLIFVCEDSIENWYTGKDDTQPNEERQFDYSDSFALVGLNPMSSAITIPSTTTAVGDKIITGDYHHTGNNTQVGNFTQTGLRTHNGPELITGSTTHNGTLIINGDIILNGRPLDAYVDGHRHNNGAIPDPTP